MKIDSTVRKYLFFMISNKEKINSGYRNRKASDFYRLLKQDSIRYNCTIIDVLRSNAYFVIKGEFKSLLK